MEAAETIETRQLKIVREPRVYLVGRQTVDAQPEAGRPERDQQDERALSPGQRATPQLGCRQRTFAHGSARRGRLR